MTPSHSKPDNFKVGDVVRLKTGGPNMVVTATTAITTSLAVVHCEWMVGNERQEGDFRADMLERADTGWG